MQLLASHLIEKITPIGVFLKNNEFVLFHAKTININEEWLLQVELTTMSQENFSRPKPKPYITDPT